MSDKKRAIFMFTHMLCLLELCGVKEANELDLELETHWSIYE